MRRSPLSFSFVTHRLKLESVLGPAAQICFLPRSHRAQPKFLQPRMAAMSLLEVTQAKS